MLTFYRSITKLAETAFTFFLNQRVKRGKEDPARLNERMGIASQVRPAGRLVWVHGASVGEAKSALILIEALLDSYPNASCLVTTGTVTSAEIMDKQLPNRGFHQFYPLDHPRWVTRFLDHWRPDCVIWMESELWPNMLLEIQKREIPAALVNARLSDRSARRWHVFKTSARHVLKTFSAVLAQTAQDAARFESLGAENVTVTDNIKYSAKPLDSVAADFETLKQAVGDRPCWVYASTHAGEEDIACEVHNALKATWPDLLTIIVPRHPERGLFVVGTCEKYGLKTVQRSVSGFGMQEDTDIFVADSLGELGLYYKLSQIACIGRTLSDDGGGGHNPIEAAQLGCAVLHGPNIQFQKEIFDNMHQADAALCVKDANEMASAIRAFLEKPDTLKTAQERARLFAEQKEHVLKVVLEHLQPVLEESAISGENAKRQSA